MAAQDRNDLSSLVQWIYQKGWAPGTGGNFSSLGSKDPFQLFMTPSGIDKGRVSAQQLLVVNELGEVIEGDGKPSAETLLHIAIIQEKGAKVVLHTHSIWNSLASLTPGGASTITGLEMLKGLSGHRSHDDAEVIPILDNSQDIPALSQILKDTLRAQPDCHGVLLRGHGLYTWGCDIFEARRHLEVLEFLFELTGRNRRPD